MHPIITGLLLEDTQAGTVLDEYSLHGVVAALHSIQCLQITVVNLNNPRLDEFNSTAVTPQR